VAAAYTGKASPPRATESTRQLALRVKELDCQLTTLNSSIICALNQLLDLKDLNTGFHSTRLAEWSLRVARELGLAEPFLHQVEIAALLHDIGKIGIPDEILNKPGPLTEAEWTLMKKHPEYGWAIMRLFPDLARASLFVLHHHERFDGSGYPGGLNGNEIPLGARLVAVIDAFDAMTTNRPYRPGVSFDEAIRRLILGRNTDFDPLVVDCFVGIAFKERGAVFAATGTGISIAL
jgi:HD-GYP domain-containing protein (c-di-GMP phosphodiesterase class II)